jgi:hypothetical protein
MDARACRLAGASGRIEKQGDGCGRRHRTDPVDTKELLHHAPFSSSGLNTAGRQPRLQRGRFPTKRL